MKLSDKTAVSEFILINTYVVCVFGASVNNDTFLSLLFKGGLSIVLFLAFYLNVRIRSIEIKSLIHCSGFKISASLIAALLIISLISLTYSQNASYGLKKCLALLISTVPIITVSYYLFHTLTPLRIRVFRIAAIVICLIAAVPVLFFNPFEFSSIYKADVFRWSHVIYGRIASTLFLLCLFLLLNARKNKEILAASIPAALSFFGTYSAGLRAALLSILIITPAYVFFKYMRGAVNILKSVIYLSVFIILLLLFRFTERDNTGRRYDSIVQQNSFSGSHDPSVAARIEAYKIAFERFLQNPVLGTGFGGFCSYYKSDIPLWMKYPHNIALEFSAELGFPGLAVFIAMIFFIFKFSAKITIECTFFTLFAILLAMSSKDIPSQSLFFIGLGYAGFRNEDKTHIARWQDSI